MMSSSQTKDTVEIILEAMTANPALASIRSAWGLRSAGIDLGDCSMDSATMALNIARDKFLGVSGVKMVSGRVVYHTGCIGDLIAALPIIRHIGGAALKVGNFQVREWQHRNMEGRSYESVRPLLERQPYLESVSFEDGAAHTHDLDSWRVCHRLNRTLTESQAAYLGIREPVDMSPWLTNIVPSAESSERIVVARSQRYHSGRFPWKGICQKHAGRMMFIGTKDEHSEFVAENGVPVEYRPTENLLEAAELILGSRLFIGNQSSPCWVAMGLGHRMIQETHPQIHDSIVRRDNAFFHYSMNPKDKKMVLSIADEAAR